MKKVCVLLSSSIQRDTRVIKTLRTISYAAKADLFYVGNPPPDDMQFNENVRLFPVKQKVTFYTKILRHSFFTDEFMFLAKAVLKTGERYDVVWANDLTCLKPGARVKKRCRAKLIYDSHEIYLETINQFFPLDAKPPKRYIFRFLIWLMKLLGNMAEKKYLKKADEFVTVSESISDFFASKYKRNHIKVLHNYSSLVQHYPVIDLHKELGLTQKEKIVIYQGGLQNGRGLEMLIEAFNDVEPNVVLLILGSGRLKPQLEWLTAQYNLEQKIYFKDPVGPEELISYTSGADFGVNLLMPINLNTLLARPNKLFEYIHANIPVIATDMVECRNIINENRVGMLTKSNPKSLAEAINKMAKTDLTDFKENCRRASLKYNWEKQEDLITDLITS
jgi:glycosyltransferase involved in cell wall biosynthesis